MTSNVFPFPVSRRREVTKFSGDLRKTPDPAAAQELLGSLSAMFRTAGCPGLADAFVEAGGGRG